MYVYIYIYMCLYIRRRIITTNNTMCNKKTKRVSSLHMYIYLYIHV